MDTRYINSSVIISVDTWYINTWNSHHEFTFDLHNYFIVGHYDFKQDSLFITSILNITAYISHVLIYHKSYINYNIIPILFMYPGLCNSTTTVLCNSNSGHCAITAIDWSDNHPKNLSESRRSFCFNPLWCYRLINF